MIPIISGFGQYLAGVSLFKNIAINLTIGISLYALLVIAERYYHTRKVVVERDTAQRNEIAERDIKIAALTQPNKTCYTKADLAALANFKQTGQWLLEEHITPNQSDADGRLDIWLNEHRNWRKEVLFILNEKDAAKFQDSIRATAERQIAGISAPLNLKHNRARIQLLNELQSIDAVISETTNP